MREFLVQMVGEKDAAIFESHNDYGAVAQAAGCQIALVCLPIWRRGATRAQAYRQEYQERCYMPLDDSGRQWIVRDRGQQGA